MRGAKLVSNPGCYATSVLLPLVPLLAAGLVDPADIVVDAKSGATGAGRAPREDLLFCEVAENLSAYSPGRSHRHVGEIESVLAERTKSDRRSHVLPAPPAREAGDPLGDLRSHAALRSRTLSQALEASTKASPS